MLLFDLFGFRLWQKADFELITISKGAHVGYNFWTKSEAERFRRRVQEFRGTPVRGTTNQRITKFTRRQTRKLGLDISALQRLAVGCVVPSDVKVKFLQAWYVVSTGSQGVQTDLPYLPHFDRDRRFKVMIYLSDVSEENGPISFAEVSQDDLASIEKTRLGLLQASDCPPVEMSKRNVVKTSLLKNVVGPAGSVVVFDTNNPHCAGSVEEGRSREVFRLDFRPKNRSKFFTFRLLRRACNT